MVIELLDARLPGSSANPLLAELTGHKPTLKILNKQDVADAARTAQWLAHYNAQPGTRAIALQAKLRELREQGGFGQGQRQFQGGQQPGMPPGMQLVS